MNIERKMHHRLQAESEMFAGEFFALYSKNQETMLRASAQLGAITDLDHLPDSLDDDVKKLVQQHKDQFIAFLKSENRVERNVREKCIATYNTYFRNPVNDLKEAINSENQKDLEYIGAGDFGQVYAFTLPNNSRYVAKFNKNISPQEIEIKAMVRALGIERVSQIIGYSFEDNVVIMNFVEGQMMSECAPETVEQIPDEHYSELIKTIQSLDSRGLSIDPKPQNILYDEHGGFSMIDYQLLSKPHNLQEILRVIPFLLSMQKISRKEVVIDHYFGILQQFMSVLNTQHNDLAQSLRDAFPRMNDIVFHHAIKQHDFEQYASRLQWLHEFGYVS